VAGSIAVGKSTLAKQLSEALGVPFFKEKVEGNKLLEDFNGDMAKYSFALQIQLLNQRYEQQQQIVWGNKGGVQDRSIIEDAIFAKMLYESGKMQDYEYETYLALSANMFKLLKKPDLIIYLVATPEICFERKETRGRPWEKPVTLEYLTNLNEGYEVYFEAESRFTPVLRGTRVASSLLLTS
jgi:deoxyadenosine kinase